MTNVTCRLTAKNRDQPRNPTLGNRVWATFLPLNRSYCCLRQYNVNGALNVAARESCTVDSESSSSITTLGTANPNNSMQYNKTAKLNQSNIHHLLMKSYNRSLVGRRWFRCIGMILYRRKMASAHVTNTAFPHRPNRT